MRLGLIFANAISRISGLLKKKTDKLNLIGCGAARCGTTSFMYYLNEHPEIAPISSSSLTHEGVLIDLPFASFDSQKVELGVKTNFYRETAKSLAGKYSYLATKRTYFTSYPFIAKNLADHLPEAKIIILLRNPVEAINSLFWFQREGKLKRYEGCEKLYQLYYEMSFEDFIGISHGSKAKVKKITSMMEAEGRLEHDRVLPDFNLNRYLYYQNLQPYFEMFNKEQIHVIKTERLFSDPAAVLRETLDFLELREQFRFTRIGQIKGSATKAIAISPATRDYLVKFYRESNEKLFKMLLWGDVDWQ